MIKMKGVSAGYHNENVIKDIDLSFEAGTITSIIGKNGSGKTTLLKTASNILESYSGEIFLDFRGNCININRFKKKELARKISYLPQHKEIPNMTVSNLVMHGRFPYLGFSRIPQKKDYEIAEKSMNDMDIFHLKDKNLQALSGGQRQRVYLAMVLAQNTEILFLDEPTTYLDIDHQFEVLKLVQELKNMGKTVVMVLHNISSALKYSDKICLMDQGRLVSYGTPEEVIVGKFIDEVFNICCEEIYVDSGKQREYLIRLKD